MRQNELQNAIRLNKQFQLQKTQFCATAELTKPVDKESLKTLVDDSNSKSQRLDFPGLSNECFAKMNKQNTLALNNFSSHGSA